MGHLPSPPPPKQGGGVGGGTNGTVSQSGNAPKSVGAATGATGKPSGGNAPGTPKSNAPVDFGGCPGCGNNNGEIHVR